MKFKNVFSLILILNAANLFAYDQQTYKELLAGGKRFANADLSKAKIENMDLSDVTFVNVNLTDACFHNSMLTNVTFDSCNLSGSIFYDMVFNNSKILNKSNLAHSIFEKVIFDSSEINNSSMAHVKLSETDLVAARIYNVDMYNTKLESVNFSACTLEHINFRAAKLELVRIYETTQIGTDLIFDQATLSQCCFLGQKERSSVIGGDFFGTTIMHSYFVNLNFDNCTRLDQVGDATKSLFDNISSISPNDLRIFAERLKFKEAKVNGEWTKDKDYWSKFESHYCKQFFAALWPSVAYLGTFAFVGLVCPAAAPIAASAVSGGVSAVVN